MGTWVQIARMVQSLDLDGTWCSTSVQMVRDEVPWIRLHLVQHFLSDDTWHNTLIQRAHCDAPWLSWHMVLSTTYPVESFILYKYITYLSNGIWYTIVIIVLYSVHITLQIRIGLLVNCVSACLDYQEMYMSDHV